MLLMNQEWEKFLEEQEILLRIQEDYEMTLDEKEQELLKKEHALKALQKQAEDCQKKTLELKQALEHKRAERLEVKENFIKTLGHKAGITSEDLGRVLSQELLHTEKLGITKWLMDHGDDLKREAGKTAQWILGTVLDRYSPTFIWPKSSFSVTLHSPEFAKKCFLPDSLCLQTLLQGSEGTTFELIQEPDTLPLLKIAGGSGVFKEIMRLSVEEINAHPGASLNRVAHIVKKYERQLDRLTLRLGEEAVRILQIEKPDVEILKLIGALNYRTSHRQNQYFHSLEVARLAGMLADEVGVDADLAKRSGLLHDIGKALDYKIEGSHAVISGDYAARYGESDQVVDTILAHHDDKIVETPHAYILKSADALSGARPGARVDMEEGYQKRIENISEVVNSFKDDGVMSTAIMHAGREVHVFVNDQKVTEAQILPLAHKIVKKLEADVQYPGQIRVTLVRRFEVTEVA